MYGKNERYEITYDCDACSNLTEEFRGDWGELKQYIKELKDAGCYNIDANYIGECDPDDYIDFPITWDAEDYL